MLDLRQFGKVLRELRERRGITQDDAVSKSGTYSEASSLRKIERGDQRPKRQVIITLLIKGLEERDPATIDELLNLAGYQALTDSERSTLGLAKPPSPPNLAVEPLPDPVRPQVLLLWSLLAGTSLIGSLLLVWFQDWFTGLAALLYAGLFVVSVLLESAHQFRGKETIGAGALAGSVILATSLGGTWAQTKRIRTDHPDGLEYALVIFVMAAILQWVLVRPALPAYVTVRSRFQPHTAQAAHLKNTLYYLFAVAAFWILPRHCIETLRHIRGMSTGTFCPKPAWLWVLLLLVIGISIPMGSRLLENLRSGPRLNLYVNLFYVRALFYFLFSAVCLIWYSNSYAALASKFMISNSP